MAERLLTRYDVKCWFYLTLPEDLRDELVLVTAYALRRGIRDGWATVAGNKQVLALIASPGYLAWLADLRSRTPPKTRPGRPGVPHQFRAHDSLVDLQAALRNFLWTGTGPYRGPKESVMYPTKCGFTSKTLCTPAELSDLRRMSAVPDVGHEALEVDAQEDDVITLSDTTSDSDSD